MPDEPKTLSAASVEATDAARLRGEERCGKCGMRLESSIHMTESQNTEIRLASHGFITRNSALNDEDCYVAWCRYTERSIVTCDSDAPKAFRVYRHPAAPCPCAGLREEKYRCHSDAAWHRQVESLRAELAAVQKGIPESYYAALPLAERVQRMVEQWKRVVTVNQAIEAELTASQERERVLRETLKDAEGWVNYLRINGCDGGAVVSSLKRIRAALATPEGTVRL